jgi:hypothetical protein
MRFEELEDIRPLLIGLLEPVKGLFVVAKTEVSVHKSARRNVALVPSLFQFR